MRKKDYSCYDIYKELRHLKEFRHVDYRTVTRRIQALLREKWIDERGSKLTQPGWDSIIYGLTVRAEAALALDKINLDSFLETVSDDQIQRLIDSLR